MTREEKAEEINNLTEKFQEYGTFYVADTSRLNASQINRFRELCYKKEIPFKVSKNTLISKALENLHEDYSEFKEKALAGPSGIMFAQTGNLPAKLIKEFKKGAGGDLIELKGASVEAAFYFGNEELDNLSKVKSKYELIGDIVGLLQSPAKNVISALQSGEHQLAGLVKTLSEREEKSE